MPAKPTRQTQQMQLAEFHRYLDGKRRELEACYSETEEVQYQFNDIFHRVSRPSARRCPRPLPRSSTG